MDKKREIDADGIEPVRIGIAGCGGITSTILRGFEDAEELDIVAVMDIDRDAASVLASDFGIPRHYTDYSELLKDDIEAVVINTPNDCHQPQALEALAAGKHCLVQKPLARSVSEAESMVEAARDAGLLLGVVMIERGDPIYRQMRAMAQEGCFGAITAVRCFMSHLNHMRNPPASGTWRSSPEKIGGGSFIQLAIHHLDLAQWILDSRIVEVAALSVGTVRPDLFPEDETAGAVVRFQSGAIGHFLSSFTSMADEIEFRGTGGMIRRTEDIVRWKVSRLFDGELWDPGRVDEIHEVWIPELANRKSELALEFEPHRRFALAVRGIMKLEVTGEVGLQDLRVVDAVQRSAREKHAISIGRE